MIDYYVDDVDLHDADRRWDLLDTSLVASPVTIRTVTLEVPGVIGTMPARGMPQSAPQYVLKFKIAAADEDTMWENHAALTWLLTQGSVLTRSTGTRTTYAAMEFQSMSEPTFLPASATVLVTAVIKLPGVFWRGASADWTKTDPTSGTAYEVTTLANSTAPVVDGLFLVTGPATTPVKVTAGSEWFSLDLSLAGGEKALVDSVAWTVRKGSGVSFSGGGSVVSGVLTNSGSPYVLRLVPVRVGSDPKVTKVTVKLTATGLTSSSALAVRAAPAYPV